MAKSGRDFNCELGKGEEIMSSERLQILDPAGASDTITHHHHNATTKQATAHHTRAVIEVPTSCVHSRWLMSYDPARAEIHQNLSPERLLTYSDGE
jgi:hypothetical protein